MLYDKDSKNLISETRIRDPHHVKKKVNTANDML